MNVFNRMLAVALFLFLILIGIIVLVTLFDFQLQMPGGVFQQELNALSELSGWRLVLASFLSVIFITILILLIALEIPRPKREHPIVLSSNEYGVVSINRRGVERLIERLGSDTTQVRDISCSVYSQPDGLQIRCEPVLALGSSLHDQTLEIQRRVREGIEKYLGLPVRKLEVRAKYEPSGAKKTEHELK